MSHPKKKHKKDALHKDTQYKLIWDGEAFLGTISIPGEGPEPGQSYTSTGKKTIDACIADLDSLAEKAHADAD